MKNIIRYSLILFCLLGLNKIYSDEMQPIFLQRENRTILEGYFLPPATATSPIIIAIQGSACKSAVQWYELLADQASAMGFGLIVLEKQGISRHQINAFEYNQTNCLSQRQEDYSLCLENISTISPGWEGSLVLLGESEGGILAAELANHTPGIGAVLLFATGGGMDPREEVKWTIRHRLETCGASTEEIEEYMTTLDAQLDATILNPTPDQQLYGNTYKWWASLLAADDVLSSLQNVSIPIFLVHGAQDDYIPVLSADLAAQTLSKTNEITYLRLEDCGHNLNNSSIQTLAFHWLQSTLSGQMNQISLTSTLGQCLCSEKGNISIDWKTDIAHYILYREGNSAEGHVSADSNGVSAEGSVSHTERNDDGSSCTFSASGDVRVDRDGNVSGSVSVGGEINW